MWLQLEEDPQKLQNEIQVVLQFPLEVKRSLLYPFGA